MDAFWSENRIIRRVMILICLCTVLAAGIADGAVVRDMLDHSETGLTDRMELTYRSSWFHVEASSEVMPVQESVHMVNAVVAGGSAADIRAAQDYLALFGMLLLCTGAFFCDSRLRFSVHQLCVIMRYIHHQDGAKLIPLAC